MTYNDLLLSAINNAMRGMLPEQSVAIDAVGLADTLFPIVSQAVSEAAASNDRKRSLLLRSKSLTFAAGQATITSDVLTHYIRGATLIDPASLSKKYSYLDYAQFQRVAAGRLGYFSLFNATTMVLREPNGAFVVPLTASGARTLVVPCVVVKPALATDPIDCSDEILSDLDEALANALRGEIVKVAGAAA